MDRSRLDLPRQVLLRNHHVLIEGCCAREQVLLLPLHRVRLYPLVVYHRGETAARGRGLHILDTSLASVLHVSLSMPSLRRDHLAHVPYYLRSGFSRQFVFLMTRWLLLHPLSGE